MARNRSNALIFVGAAVFVVGAALTLLVVGGDDRGSELRAAATAQAAPAAPAAPAGQAAGGVSVPEGREAVAVMVPRVPGLVDYAKVGDRVNVFGAFKDRQPAGAVKGAPLAKLVVSNAEVLAVNAAPAGSEGGNNTYLLAVTAEEAEKVIYLASYESIWLTLTRDGAPPVLSTPGRNAQNAA